MRQIKRIIIEGEKVHNVGYRPFLLWKVREIGISNYDARNVKENGMERVVVSVGGEEKQIQEFVKFVKENYPEKARVSRIWEDPKPPERVMLVDEYDKVLAAEQQNTVVQSGLVMIDMQKEALRNQRKMLDKQDQMLEKQDQTIGAIDKLDVNVNMRFDNLDVKYGKIAENMEKILEEMKEERKEARKSMERILNAILKLAEKSG
ncbi:MAG: hypothetical protein DRO76_04215 [Candidatus Altiarchaeales archaeon]|nr:MAG: hypothetical protein DRO76_04215 [Candidatus Altiarchaeales archaeon]